MTTDAALAKKIRAYLENDTEGYDRAVDLLLEVAAVLEARAARNPRIYPDGRGGFEVQTYSREHGWLVGSWAKTKHAAKLEANRLRLAAAVPLEKK